MARTELEPNQQPLQMPLGRISAFQDRETCQREAVQAPGSGSSSALQTQQRAGVTTSLYWPVWGVVHQVGSVPQSASGRQPSGQAAVQGRSGTLTQRQQYVSRPS